MTHQGLFPAVTISFNLKPGVALGDAVNADHRGGEEVGLPPTIHTQFAGTAQAYQDSLSSEPILIAAALVTVYLILAILYESYIHPITIISSLPAASVGALLALLFTHTDLSIIAIIGIILLIGIVKKNAIMMIDFALAAERNEGKNSYDSIVEACTVALPPDPDDHHGRAAGRLAAGAGNRHWVRASPSAGNHDHRRADHEPAADAIHDTGGVSILRQPPTLVGPRARSKTWSSRAGQISGIERGDSRNMILLLGSEPVLRAVMQEVLEQAGHVVLATGNLGTAVDMLADCKVDLLITHPYVDSIAGHEAAKYLRGKNPQMGVLLVAGLLDDDRLLYREDLAGFDVFPAPSTAAQLVEKVKEVLKATEERAARMQTHNL